MVVAGVSDDALLHSVAFWVMMFLLLTAHFLGLRRKWEEGVSNDVFSPSIFSNQTHNEELFYLNFQINDHLLYSSLAAYC